MADNKKKYELVAWGKNPGKVPRWLLPALNALDKIAEAGWDKTVDKNATKAAYEALKAGVGAIDWTYHPEAPYNLDTALVTPVGANKAKLLDLLSEAFWAQDEAIIQILTQGWAIWDKGKKPSNPSQAFLKMYNLGKSGTSTPVTIDPIPGPKPPPNEPETEEGGFPWWILAVAGVGAAWFFLSDREKKKRRVIGSRI